MSSLLTKPAPEYPGVAPLVGEDQSLNELRWLLFASEQQQIEALRHRLDDPRKKADELSQCVAEALAIRSLQDRKLQATLQPLIESALAVEAARDPQRLVASLTPVLWPMLGNVVLRALRSKLAWLNHHLGRSLSLEDLRWRIAAWRSGHPFDAVALTGSRRYRVEQAFLIHRETGRLHGHAGARPEGDYELLAAIESLQGSLAGGSSVRGDASQPARPDRLIIGERTLWLSHGPRVTLAAMVSGFPPKGLERQLATENEIIHEVFGADLVKHHADSELIAAIDSHLRGCLMLGRRKIGAKTSYRLLWTVALVLAMAFAAVSAWAIRDAWRWKRYIDHLDTEPGIVVIAAQSSWMRYSVRGLRDPLASDPLAELVRSGIPLKDVSEHWDPYFSLDPEMTRRRPPPVAGTGTSPPAEARHAPE